MNRQHYNINGLQNGCIPALNICPFLNRCPFKINSCPSEDNLLDQPFACATARSYSLLITLGKPL